MRTRRFCTHGFVIFTHLYALTYEHGRNVGIGYRGYIDPWEGLRKDDAPGLLQADASAGANSGALEPKQVEKDQGVEAKVDVPSGLSFDAKLAADKRARERPPELAEQASSIVAALRRAATRELEDGHASSKALAARMLLKETAKPEGTQVPGPEAEAPAPAGAAEALPPTANHQDDHDDLGSCDGSQTAKAKKKSRRMKKRPTLHGCECFGSYAAVPSQNDVFTFSI